MVVDSGLFLGQPNLGMHAGLEWGRGYGAFGLGSTRLSTNWNYARGLHAAREGGSADGGDHIREGLAFGALVSLYIAPFSLELHYSIPL